MNSPVRLGVSSTTTTPTGFFQSEVLRLHFPSLEPWVAQSALLPSCSPQFMRTQMWDCLLLLLLPHLVCQLPPFCKSSPLWLLVSTPPTSMDECFIFNSLAVEFPYSSIFWQLWLIFVFKFVVVLLVVGGGKVYLPTPPSWPEVLGFLAFGSLPTL